MMTPPPKRWEGLCQVDPLTGKLEESLHRLRAPNKMSLHSSGLFSLWTASGSINHPRLACFHLRQGYCGQVAFLARGKNARSRCDDHFVRGSKREKGDR